MTRHSLPAGTYRALRRRSCGSAQVQGSLADLFRLMLRGGKPTVARVNGHALAGGFGLAIACDVTVCVDDAKLGTPRSGSGCGR